MDKGTRALEVLKEIEDLIRDRIGESMKPEEPEAMVAEEMPPVGGSPTGEAMPSQDDEDLAALYESEGVGMEEPEEDEKKKVV